MYDQSPENQKSLGKEVISDWISSQAFAQRIRSGRFTSSSTKEQALSMLQGKFCYILDYTKWKISPCFGGAINEGVFLYPKSKRVFEVAQWCDEETVSRYNFSVTQKISTKTGGS